MTSQRPGKSSPQVTGARAAAQRDKLDTQAEASRSAEQEAPPKAKGKKEQKQLLAKRRANTRLERAITDYLADQEGGNHSAKTLEWHRTALGLLKSFLKEERAITLVGEVDAPISTLGLSTCARRREVTARHAANARCRPMRVRFSPASSGC